jgi:hypothetical protein
MLEILLLDTLTIVTVFWFIADPNQAKAHAEKKARLRAEKKSASATSAATSSASAIESTGETPPVLRAEDTQLEANGSEIPYNEKEELDPDEGKKQERQRFQKIAIEPIPGEAKWPSLSPR